MIRILVAPLAFGYCFSSSDKVANVLLFTVESCLGVFGYGKDTIPIEYDIGIVDHRVTGTYEIDGTHQILGPFTRAFWGNVKAWNHFRFRASPKSEEPSWSRWTEFKF